MFFAVCLEAVYGIYWVAENYRFVHIFILAIYIIIYIKINIFNDVIPIMQKCSFSTY